MFRRTLLIAMLVAGVAAAGLALAAGSNSRPDCPGKIICPLTGELVCKDRCPLGETQQDDDQQAQLPACCRKD